MSGEPLHHIVAIRRADFTGHAAGGVLAKCPVCHQEILLSPASQRRMQEGAVAYCSVCIVEVLAECERDGYRICPEFPTAAESREARGLTEKN